MQCVPQVARIIGKKSKEAVDILGYVGPQFIVDRNNIALLVRSKLGGPSDSTSPVPPLASPVAGGGAGGGAGVPVTVTTESKGEEA